MPPIYYLNPPPNPFWDFVAGLEDHPFFAQGRRPVPETPPPYPPRPAREEEQATAGPSEKAKGKQAEGATANVEDPPEVDPSTLGGESAKKGFPFRGRGRFTEAFNNDKDDKAKDNDGDGEKCRKRGHPGCPGGRGFHRGGPTGFGPPPFAFGPPWARYGQHGPGEGPEGGPPFRGGPFGRGWGGRGRGGPHHHGRHGRRSPSPSRGFDLAAFLNRLGERLGLDLSAAAEGLGLEVDRFKAGRTGNDVDFEPRTDIFDAPSTYTIHLSLPGAKKSDVGVEWDGENSVLRVTGVVHRPAVDEELMRHLSVDGRKRETGVFEKSIRLGTKKDPASIDIAGITAKMVDGVLVIHVPKVEKRFEKKEVRVDGSPEISVEQPEEAYLHEEDVLFDAEEGRDDEPMHDAEPTAVVSHPPTPAKASFGDAAASATKGKQHEAEQERARSATVDFEQPNTTAAEALPKYEKEDSLNNQGSPEEDMSDWDKAGSEDEGEYVKINVN